MIVQWRKERYPESPICHCIEQPVASGCKEQVEDDPRTLNATVSGFGSDESDRDSSRKGKQKRMGEASVSPECAVRNPKIKAGDVNVGQHRTEGARNPEASWDTRPIKS